jgi:hypothetical protein
MAQTDGLGDGVIAREENRQRPALNLQPVHGSEALGHGVLLAGALTLETGDVVLQLTHLRLGALDPAVEQRHLLALLAQSPVYRLELGEKARFALSRFRGLGALILEPPLRLLERVLLVPKLRVVFLLLRRRGQGQSQHEEEERQRDPE